MWIDHLENPETIKAIYQSELPELTDIELTEMKIDFGEDINCSIKFNLRNLPKTLPQKWAERKVSIVQIDLLLLKVELKQFNTNTFNFVGDLKFTVSELAKTIHFESNGKLFFTIDATWIYVRSISGHTRSSEII
jgi:hypothetical protein